MEGIGGDYLTDERMVPVRTSHLYGEIGSQSSGVSRECNDSFCFTDEDFDFRSTVYPGRELSAFLLFIFATITFVVWGGLHLTALI